MRAALIMLVGVTAFSMSAVVAHAQTARIELHAPSDPYAGFIAEASQRFGIPAAWIRAIMRVESRGDRRAISPKGAIGLMQLMPDTWAALRARYGLGRDPFDAHDNILAGAAFLREMHDRYGSPGFLAAYNAGPGRYEAYRDRTARCRPRRSPMSRDLPSCRGRRDRWACPRGGRRSSVLDAGAAVHHAAGEH